MKLITCSAMVKKLGNFAEEKCVGVCVCFAALENPLTEICWYLRNPNLFRHFTGPGQN